ncbi:type II CRISPR-associated endonuclease Cas1 [Paracoccaceae bacterium]|nr:type II CRISPR-associated endonuclease Cas1 [Paracoccaceae bacterium]
MDGRHLAKFRGFLTISELSVEIGRVPFDDILSLIIHAHGVTYTNSLVVELAKRGTPIVICGSNHSPEAVVWPISGHHAQGARMRAQWNASRPLLKQLWKAVVIKKIHMQAAALNAFGFPDAGLLNLSNQVKSGDLDNIEAQAARRYWPMIMGKKFRRDRNLDGANAMLNYGYTILRATTSRAILGAGLHPTIGIHHHNSMNSFALSDDLMEPFRPLIDCMVVGLIRNGHIEVTPEVKYKLSTIIAFDLTHNTNTTTVFNSIGRLILSLAQSYELGRVSLDFPKDPTSLELNSLGED